MFVLTPSNLVDKKGFRRSLNIEKKHLCPEISAIFAMFLLILAKCSKQQTPFRCFTSETKVKVTF